MRNGGKEGINSTIVWLIIIALIVTLGYLSRNLPAPPDCRTQPQHPACKEK